jgi:hypothetical protein
MKPNPSFQSQPSDFWALVKYASESLGYSNRSRKTSDTNLKRYNLSEVQALADDFAISDNVEIVVEYLNYRANLIKNDIRPLLMDRESAQTVFNDLFNSYTPNCHLPMNKQKGEKRHYSYFTCIVNMLTEKNLRGRHFNDNPRNLCLITNTDNRLVKTLSRGVDGTYPDILNPIAIWEIKEYYGTTTFGSRVADGVYETLLDGYEIIEAEEVSGRKIEHYLLVDDWFTWWVKGKSYLCRLVDMTHAGFVDEVIFGREALTRWPEIVRFWLRDSDDLPSQ